MHNLNSDNALNFEIIIIGAGLSGIMCAIKLLDNFNSSNGIKVKYKTISLNNILIVDRASDIGGAQHQNQYPGCACDVESYAYLPMLDRTGYTPTQKYIDQKEIKHYCNLLVDSFEGLRDRIKLNCCVEKLEWQQKHNCWKITCMIGRQRNFIKSRFCIVATGPLSKPIYPEIESLEKFPINKILHTARWNPNVDFKDKRIGIIGTGCSAAQLLVALVEDEKICGNPKEIFVFQRTASQCVPRNNETLSKDIERRLSENRGSNDKLRIEQQKQVDNELQNDIHDLDPDNGRNKYICSSISMQIDSSINNNKLLTKKLSPLIPFYSKRPLRMDNYYSSFNNKRVKLIADPKGVIKADENGLYTANGEYVKLDFIVCATGFDLFSIMIEDIIGRNNISLHKRWNSNQKLNKKQTSTSPHTLYGIHTQNFPNLFFIAGPQSINPTANVTYVAEIQINYIVKLIDFMKHFNFLNVDLVKGAEEYQAKICLDSTKNKVQNFASSYYNKQKCSDKSANFWSTVGEYKYFLGKEIQNISQVKESMQTGNICTKFLIFDKLIENNSKNFKFNIHSLL